MNTLEMISVTSCPHCSGMLQLVNIPEGVSIRAIETKNTSDSSPDKALGSKSLEAELLEAAKDVRRIHTHPGGLYTAGDRVNAINRLISAVAAITPET